MNCSNHTLRENYIKNIQNAMPYHQDKGISTNALNFVIFGILLCQDKKLSIQFEKPNIMKVSKEDEGYKGSDMLCRVVMNSGLNAETDTVANYCLHFCG